MAQAGRDALSIKTGTLGVGCAWGGFPPLFLGETLMTGWKTKAAALLSVSYGTLGLLLGMHDSDAAVQFIVQGIGLLGIGHKIEKTKQ